MVLEKLKKIKKKYKTKTEMTDIRIYRALSQPLYLVEDNFPEIHVMGSTGNVYKVEMASHPTCNCPDYLRRRAPCKHILFLLLRYYRLSEGDVYCDLSDELLNRIAETATNKNVYCSKELLRKWKSCNDERKEREEETNDEEGNDVRLPDPDDCCPICLEEFENVDASSLIRCVYSCGNYTHAKCFDMYRKHNAEAKCPHCRATIPNTKKETKEKKESVWSDYKNLYD